MTSVTLPATAQAVFPAAVSAGVVAPIPAPATAVYLRLFICRSCYVTEYRARGGKHACSANGKWLVVADRPIKAGA